MKFSRRRLALALAGSAVSITAQTAPPSQGRDEELEAARQRIRANSEALRTVTVAMVVEPSFQFRV